MFVIDGRFTGESDFGSRRKAGTKSNAAATAAITSRRPIPFTALPPLRVVIMMIFLSIGGGTARDEVDNQTG
jgi:hypothetical protein